MVLTVAIAYGLVVGAEAVATAAVAVRALSNMRPAHRGQVDDGQDGVGNQPAITSAVLATQLALTHGVARSLAGAADAVLVAALVGTAVGEASAAEAALLLVGRARQVAVRATACR